MLLWRYFTFLQTASIRSRVLVSVCHICLQMACFTLTQNDASDQQSAIIRQYIDRLSGVGEVEKIRGYGVTVNGVMFQADADYRTEVIYRLAK